MHMPRIMTVALIDRGAQTWSMKERFLEPCTMYAGKQEHWQERTPPRSFFYV
jgi:hypothetical protein